MSKRSKAVAQVAEPAARALGGVAERWNEISGIPPTPSSGGAWIIGPDGGLIPDPDTASTASTSPSPAAGQQED